MDVLGLGGRNDKLVEQEETLIQYYPMEAIGLGGQNDKLVDLEETLNTRRHSRGAHRWGCGVGCGSKT